MAPTKELLSKSKIKSKEYVDESSTDEESARLSAKKLQGRVSKLAGNKTFQSGRHSSLDVDSGSSASPSPSVSSAPSVSSSSSGKRRQSDATSKVLEPVNKKQKTTSQKTSTTTLPVPSGYDLVRSNVDDFSSQTKRMFTEIDGKQVWYITTPASLPLSMIEELDIHAALRGEPILHHNNISYRMHVTPIQSETLLLPKNADNTYTQAKIDISRSLSLRKVEKFDEQSESSQTSKPDQAAGRSSSDADDRDSKFFAIEPGVKKLPREQPLGLSMRYQPYGRSTTTKRPYVLPNPEIDGGDMDMIQGDDTTYHNGNHTRTNQVHLINTPIKSKKPKSESSFSTPRTNDSRNDSHMSPKSTKMKPKQPDAGAELAKKKKKSFKLNM